RTDGARAHADTRRRRCRRRCGCCDRRLFALGDLLRDRCRFRGTSDLEIVATAAKIDDVFIVRVFENSHEHALAQTFRIAPEQLARTTTHFACAYGFITWCDLSDSTSHEVERFGARQALARDTDRG